MKLLPCFRAAFLFLLFLVPAGMSGQITINRADMETVLLNSKRMNYTFNYNINAAINLGSPSGSQQAFNFGSIPPEDSLETQHQEYIDPTGQPGASDFPTATICSPLSFDPFPGATFTLVAYMSIEDDGVYMLGYYTHAVIPPFTDTTYVEKYLPKQLVFPLPMTYGTDRTSVDTLYFDQASNSYTVTTTHVTCDGWGDITYPPLPGASSPKVSVESALRFTIDQVEEDYFSGIFTSRNREVEVNYIALDGGLVEVQQPDTAYSGGVANVESITYSQRVGAATGIREIPAGVPGEFSLSQNYPNPFNPTTVFTITVPSPEFVSVKVYDLLGREIAELAGRTMTPGTYEITFDANDLPSGIYVYRMVAGTYVETRKMNVIK